MKLTKQMVCANLYTATLANPKVQERYKSRAGVEKAAQHAADKCLNKKFSLPKKRKNPATAGCPTKTVTIKGRRGKVITSFKARVCGKGKKRGRRK